MDGGQNCSLRQETQEENQKGDKGGEEGSLRCPCNIQVKMPSKKLGLELRGTAMDLLEVIEGIGRGEVLYRLLKRGEGREEEGGS